MSSFQRRNLPVANPHRPGPSNPVPIRKNDPGSGAPTETRNESAPLLHPAAVDEQIPTCIVLPFVIDSEMNSYPPAVYFPRIGPDGIVMLPFVFGVNEIVAMPFTFENVTTSAIVVSSEFVYSTTEPTAVEENSMYLKSTVIGNTGLASGITQSICGLALVSEIVPEHEVAQLAPDIAKTATAAASSVQGRDPCVRREKEGSDVRT